MAWASRVPGKWGGCLQILPVRLPSTGMRGANPASPCTGLAWRRDFRPRPEGNPLELEIRRRLRMKTLLPSRTRGGSEAGTSPDTSCPALRKGWAGAREGERAGGRTDGREGGICPSHWSSDVVSHQTRPGPPRGPLFSSCVSLPPFASFPVFPDGRGGEEWSELLPNTYGPGSARDTFIKNLTSGQFPGYPQPNSCLRG